MFLRFGVLGASFLALTSLVSAQWTFSDGKAIIAKKGSTARVTEQFSPKNSLGTVTLSPSETLKLALTLRNSAGPARPHQAFLLVSSGDAEHPDLETFFPLAVKGMSGKARVEVPYSSLPAQFQTADQPLHLSVHLASFSSEAPSTLPIGYLHPAAPSAPPATPVTYASKPIITHTFRPAPRSPPKVLTLVFTLAVVLTVPLLLLAWVGIGANVSALPRAMKAAPASYGVFLGSLAALEGVFFMYYVQWSLFRTLAVALPLGIAAIVGGKGALGEVRGRRIRGER